jgi:hypothetical protein
VFIDTKRLRIVFNLAISQRDSENYYDFIGSSADQIRTNLVEFFTNHIQDKFPSTDFVVDIYRKDSVRIYFRIYHCQKFIFL